MEGSETGGTWVGLGLGREDGVERDGRHVGGNEARGWGRDWGGKMEGSETGAGEGKWRAARRGGEWSGVAGLRYGLGCPKCAECTRQTWLR